MLKNAANYSCPFQNYFMSDVSLHNTDAQLQTVTKTIHRAKITVKLELNCQKCAEKLFHF